MTKIDKIVWALALMVGLCIVLSFVLDCMVTVHYIQNGYEQRVQDDIRVWVKVKDEEEK
jgi:hypothetical protein